MGRHPNPEFPWATLLRRTTARRRFRLIALRLIGRSERSRGNFEAKFRDAGKRPPIVPRGRLSVYRSSRWAGRTFRGEKFQRLLT